MIDSYIYFEPDEEATELAKKLGFDKLIHFSSFKVIKNYNKDSLLSHIKSLKYDFIIDIEDNLKCFTPGIAKTAGEKKVGVIFIFNKILNSNSYQRSKYLSNMKKVIRLCIKYKVPIVISSGANNKWELRGYSELYSFGKVLGMNGVQIKNALNPQKYIKRDKIIKEV